MWYQFNERTDQMLMNELNEKTDSFLLDMLFYQPYIYFVDRRRE